METIVLHVDSKFRNKNLFPNTGKFNCILDNPIKNIQAIRLSSFEFPNVFYEFMDSKGNNYFYLNEVKITVPNGNYTSDTLISTINSLIATYIGSEITFSYSRITGLVTITSTSPIPFLLNLLQDVETCYPSLGYYLGIRVPQVSNMTKYTGDSIIRTIGDNYFFLKVNDYGKIGTELNDNYVMAKIIINKNKNCMVFDDSANFITKTHVFYQPVNINKLCIELIDAYGNTIDMNYVDYSLTLEVDHIYNSYTKVQSERGYV
jgi:hypothetical protein